jgi:UDP-N-acetyl-D-mannosaminuronic acid dehydrogenase
MTNDHSRAETTAQTTTAAGARPGLYGSQRPAAEQREALVTGQVPVAVYGLGKMGLPLAAVYAETTQNVIGFDIDQDVVDSVNAGTSHVEREPGLDDLVATTVADGAFRATTDPTEAATEGAVHVIIVPTLITEQHEPDLSALEACVETIADGLAPGDLVVVECTVPPGTCDELVVPLLEERSGLSFGEFGVAFCPERTSSGRALEDIRGAYPKIVGGVDAESGRVAELIYGEINANGVIPVSDARTAEAVKLFEGLYRDVNIALANELGRVQAELGIDVTEAIEAANTQPFCDIHDPGAGVGGHCIPYYPYFVMGAVDAEMPVLQTSREVNDSMPRFTADRTVDMLAEAGKAPEDATVLVLGLTYRPAIAETRATPAKGVVDSLRARGARVLAVDPVLEDTSEFDAERVDLADIYDHTIDAVVMVTPHEEFETIDWGRFDDLVMVDGRDALGETGHPTYVVGGGRRV